MSDTRRMLAEMADPLFAELGPEADKSNWPRLEELGLPLLLVSEEDGGFGGNHVDALTVFRLAGYHALGLPLVEQIIARREVEGSDAHFRLGAFARTAQIAGALDAALAISVAYVNERQQFGRPLAKFQAVQQDLATFACEAAAANCAAMGAAEALDRGDAAFEVAAAKLRANSAASAGARIAHQVHGAIGFTQEYPLHCLTGRLRKWRSEFGGDAHWGSVLGDLVVARGADLFWPDLTARTG